MVAERDGEVVGYTYASAYRPRPAYRFTVENSIYVAPDRAGQGIGRRLIDALVEAATAAGYRQMIAVIGDSANAASITLHSRAGFRMIGTFEAVGFKFGRWIDSVYMQRALEKSGFVRCGRIYTEDGSPRWAYYHKAATQKASSAGEAVRAADG